MVSLALAAVFIALAPFTAVAGDFDEVDSAYEQGDATDGEPVEGVSGRTTPIGGDSYATVDVPEGMVYINAAGARKLLEDYWGNPKDETVLGALVPTIFPTYDVISVAFIFYADNSGHVKDDDAADIDYSDLLEELQESALEQNEELVKQGFPKTEVVGWAKAPAYDSNAKILRWAKHLRFTYGDGEVNDCLNYDVRILGRKGFVMMQAIASMEDADFVIALGDSLAPRVSFVSGMAYSDFDSTTDEVSGNTILGLVAGTTILAKTGLLAKIGLLLVKGWKIVLVAIVAIGALIAKLFKRKKEDDEPDSNTPAKTSDQ